MKKRIKEPARETPVRTATDVLVVGGGPAGLMAAVAAARSGARTLLVERYGFLGGMLTAGGVTNIRTFNDGAGRLVVGGIPMEFVGELARHNGTRSDPWKDPHVRQFLEVTKFVAQEFALAAGVELLLHAFAVAVVTDKGAVNGLIVESKSGREAIMAKVVVDATGDGDVAARAGAAFMKGWSRDKRLMQPMTSTFVFGGVKSRSWPWKMAPETRDIFERAQAAGQYVAGTPRAPGGLFALPRRGQVFANATRMAGDATDVSDLTRAEIEGRRQIWGLIDFYRRRIPEFKDVFLQASACQVGIRETRRIRGVYVLTRDDVLEARDFPDGVARGVYCIDVHSPTDGRTTYLPLKPGTSYGIPYRCLVPKKIDNLLVAGRCISATEEAHGSCRAMATCMATGQAAGTAAALAVRNGVTPGKLDPAFIQKVLQGQKAII